MVDTFVDKKLLGKCIDCRACSAICPERSIYITDFNHDGETTYHVHFKKEKQICGRCIRENNYAPCVEICPEQALEIISR